MRDEEALWAPPRLARDDREDASGLIALQSKVIPPWEDVPLAPLRALTDTVGFEAGYALQLSPLRKSQIVGDATAVSDEQITILHSALSVSDMHIVVLSLTHRHVVASIVPTSTACALVVIVQREYSNAGLAKLALKQAIEQWPHAS